MDVSNETLSFDGPVPEHIPWPFKLKVTMGILIVSIGVLVGAIGGIFLNNRYFDPHPVFDPITFMSPALVVSIDGNTPKIGNLPAPSILIGDETIPMQLVRTIDCINYDCPDGAIPIDVDLSWVEVNIEDTTIKSFPILDDFKLNYEEGSDYSVGEVFTVTNNLGPLTIPDEVKDYIKENKKVVSAWRVEGTTSPRRSHSASASWVSEVIHVWAPNLED